MPTLSTMPGDTTMHRSIQRFSSAVACLYRSVECSRPLMSCLLALSALALWPLATHAACSAFQPLPELYVGDTDTNSATYDAACTQGDIQSAIDAATCVYGTKIFVTHELATPGQ